MKFSDIMPQHGERACLVGMTGSGKTSLATHILKHFDVPPIIYDTKVEPKFLRLPKSVLVSDPDELFFKYNNNVDINQQNGEEQTIFDYFVVQPDAEELRDPEAMDDKWLNFHYDNFQGVPAYIDEIFQWSKNSRAHRGLLNLLTRGRSRGITTVISSQRPRWMPVFCLTEADRLFVMMLNNKQDRSRLAEFIPDFDPDTTTARHYFRHYRQGDDAHQLFAPIPLDESIDTGYTDISEPVSLPDDENTSPSTTNWI